jgi:hypothetical protein
MLGRYMEARGDRELAWEAMGFALLSAKHILIMCASDKSVAVDVCPIGVVPGVAFSLADIKKVLGDREHHILDAPAIAPPNMREVYWVMDPAAEAAFMEMYEMPMPS